MTVFIETPIISTLQVEITPEAKDTFVNWQADYWYDGLQPKMLPQTWLDLC